jgi:DNA-binding SARP family transcriptional activator
MSYGRPGDAVAQTGFIPCARPAIAQEGISGPRVLCQPGSGWLTGRKLANVQGCLMVQFKLLGPLEVTGPDGPCMPTAPKQRQLLVMLLLNVDQAVPTSRLIDELWDGRPPPKARATLQTYIYQLRRILGEGRPDAGPCQERLAIVTSRSGYQLRLGPDDRVDMHDFQALLQRGRVELVDGRVAVAAGTLREALQLWRGDALTDVVAGPTLGVEATRLAEVRMAALTLRIEADLQLGRHTQLVTELTALAAENPTNERYAGMLMTALHRCGRRSQALEAYQRMRAELVEQLGIEPAAETKRLHRAILADDPSLRAPEVVPASAPSVAKAPAQLPADLPDFVGRQRELDLVHAWAAAQDGCGPRIVVVTGRAGIGKTVFVRHAAHQLRPSFPDGQFYVDLREVNEGTRSVADVLAWFLRAVGFRSPLHGYGAAELAGMFRTWAADRRVLLVVDSLVSAAQLQELLPSGAGSMVLAASMLPIEALPGLHPVELPLLTTAECLALLGKLIGADRVAAERGSAIEVASLCDHLPLAVAAAGARLMSRPTWSLARLVRRLRREEDRLDELSQGGFALVSSTEASYRLLAKPQRRAFRLIAASSGSVRPVAAARLLGLGESAAEAILDRLVDVHLVEEHRRHLVEVPAESACYRVPGLIRLVARTLPDDEPDPQPPGALAA